MTDPSSLDEPLLAEIQDIKFQPYFILGLPRSGTSILYKLLTETGTFNSVTSYHLIRYDELLHNRVHRREESETRALDAYFRNQGKLDRGIDEMEVSADFGEEYGFLLERKTLFHHLTARNLGLFTELVKKVQYLAKNDNPILLKNPADFDNFLYLKRVLPSSKFVFIHRHPLKVLSSGLRAARTLLKTRDPYTEVLSEFYRNLFKSPLFRRLLVTTFFTMSSLGVLLLTLSAARAVSYYVKNVQKLPSGDYVSIRYEDLCKNPQETIGEILSAFAIDGGHAQPVYSQVNPRGKEAPPEVNRMRGFIYRCMRRYFNEIGYSRDAASG